MGHPARLLLVDDDETNRDVLSRMLFRSGYDVDLAEDGAQALELLAGHRYDLVLLDNTLPGLSGAEVLQRIRRTRPASELPVIMITAQPDSEDVVAALQMGANDCVAKPVDFAITVARIEARLALCLADRELRRTRDLYQLASRASGEGLWDWDLAAGRVAYSPQWKALLGLADEEVSDSLGEWIGRLHPADRLRILAQIQASIEGGEGRFECEYRLRHKDGGYRWVENRGGVSRNATGRAIRMAGCHTDVTERRTIDALTLLPNRISLEETLRVAQAAGTPVTLLLFELDTFERVAESLGAGASRLIAAAAARLRGVLLSIPEEKRPAATRSGDHQFGMLLRGGRDAGEIQELAARLQAVLSMPYPFDGAEIFVPVSAGIAGASGNVSPEELLRNANVALRHARELGAGNREVFQSGIRERELEDLRLESDLRLAIERSEFLVYYQPKVDLDTGEISGFEALVRWERPGCGLVPPDDFVPFAERTGLIVEIDRQVLERACRDTAALRYSFPELGVSVNVSARQLTGPGLVDHVRACLQSSGLAPSALHLEITETAVMDDPDTALGILLRLREMGVGLKLDDFGSGYSSLSYLQRFPFDTLKIDRSFVSVLGTTSENIAIIRAILALARALHLSVVAEGIETLDQLKLLKDMGCHYGQGFWFSKPVALERLKELLADNPVPKEPRAVDVAVYQGLGL